jgi:hypothetical protein
MSEKKLFRQRGWHWYSDLFMSIYAIIVTNTHTTQSGLFFCDEAAEQLPEPSEVLQRSESAPSSSIQGVVLRSLIGAQTLVCKISPLVTVTVTVTRRDIRTTRDKSEGLFCDVVV